MNDLISLVIPIYNVEKFLPRCLKSVINQTYENLEIILVNDGSPDNCEYICELFAKKDNRIKVIHKKNGGLSSARNLGIKVAHGKYITFIDSDDMVTNDFVEVLYRNIIQSDAQISICGYEFINEESNPDIKLKNNVKIIQMNSTTAIKKMLYQKQINNSAWGKLYLREIFDDIEYPEGKIYEDVPVTYKTFLKSNNIVVTSQKCYLYTKREESISAKFNEKTFDIIENVNYLADDLKDKAEFRKAINSRVLNADFFVIRQIDKDKYPKMYNELLEDIKTRRMISLFDLNTRIKTKIGIIISFFGVSVLKKIYIKNKDLKIVKKLD